MIKQNLTKKKIVLLIILVIIVYMANETWGMMPKSQVDGQLIEERIAQMIQAHEEDPEAHLGEGESLQAHRQNEVIDHPELSIVPDKFSNAETFFDLGIYPPDPTSADNCEIFPDAPFSRIEQDTSYSGSGNYPIADFDPFSAGYVDGDAIVDVVVSAQGSSGTWQNEIAFSWGKIQFKAGQYRIGYYTTSWQYTSWTSITTTDTLRFRFFYSTVDGKLYVYLRNLTVLDVSYTLAFEDDTFQAIALVNRGTSTITRFYLSNFKIWFAGF